MMELKILPEIEENLFPLQPEELKLLEESILAEGVRDALIVWPKDGELILVDGHNRYRIAKQHGIPFEIKEKCFNDIDEVLEWVDFNQLGRRNLLEEQRDTILGRLYKRKKGPVGRPPVPSSGNVDKMSTFPSSTIAKEIAKRTGFNERTIRRSADFVNAVDKIKEISPKAAEQIMNGKIKDALTTLPQVVKKSPEILKDIAGHLEKSPGKIKDILREIKFNKINSKESDKVNERLIKVSLGDWWQLGRHILYCGDTSREEFISKLPHFTFTFADPPYNAGVDEWDANFEWKHDWLIEKSDIVIVTPGIASLFDFARKTTMPYKWSIACWIDNGRARGALGFGNWIYAAIFSKNSIYCNSQDFVKVSLTPKENDDTNHRGRKPLSFLKWLIETFTKKDDVILDPFLGSGTTLIAAEQAGRICYGGEISPEYCSEIISRWEGLTNLIAEKVSDEIASRD